MTRLTFILFIFLAALSACKKEETPTPNAQRIEITVNTPIIENTTWDGDKRYIIQSNLKIENNAVLTIEAGTIIKMESGTKIEVGLNSPGTIKAIGTASQPIIFTTNATNPQRGDWGGLYFHENSMESEFQYCTFEYGGGLSNSHAIINMYDAVVGFSNCNIMHSESYGIDLRSEGAHFSSFNENTIKDTRFAAIRIPAAAVRSINNANTYDAFQKIKVTEGDFILSEGVHNWQTQSIPYLITSSLIVRSTKGITLQINPGARLEFEGNTQISVGDSLTPGKFTAIGTSSQPIVFTASTEYPFKGDWNGIWFYGGTISGTHLDYCTISYGGGGGNYGGNIAMIQNVGANISISNSTLSFSSLYGVYKHQPSFSTPVLNNIYFEENDKGDVNW